MHAHIDHQPGVTSWDSSNMVSMNVQQFVCVSGTKQNVQGYVIPD